MPPSALPFSSDERRERAPLVDDEFFRRARILTAGSDQDCNRGNDGGTHLEVFSMRHGFLLHEMSICVGD